jgi:2-polyprenyl-3-methyl-5-hydroxy-6-metoxy-1,4-benzoquinol methylase
MNLQSYGASDTQDFKGNNSLTKEDDWAKYYSGRQIEQIERAAHQTSIIDNYLKNKSGKIFELGCGASHVLARAAMFGWEVGGIDFNSNALDLIRTYLSKNGFENMNLICGDIFSYNCSQLNNKYDLLVSFGFLEHFKNPQSIISKWGTILKPEGIIISVIPNLFSINTAIFKKYDPDFWAQHIIYSPDDMDQFHFGAGYIPLKKAQFSGHFDIHMLIPWHKIRQKIGNKFIFRITKSFAYYGVEKLFGFLPGSNLKKLNSFVIGVYMRQPNG